jgi:hypothetical protein
VTARQVPHGWWRRRGVILVALAAATTAVRDGAIGKVLGEGRVLGAVRMRVVVMLGSSSVADVSHAVVSLLWVHRVVGLLVVI